jgi:hypothetical protein
MHDVEFPRAAGGRSRHSAPCSPANPISSYCCSLFAAIEAVHAPLPRDECEAMSVDFNRFGSQFMKRVQD